MKEESNNISDPLLGPEKQECPSPLSEEQKTGMQLLMSKLEEKDSYTGIALVILLRLVGQIVCTIGIFLPVIVNPICAVSLKPVHSTIFQNSK